eukprot:TRINITY_DN535_c0_g1_i14.p2 TRINITY_DN535_c0_g1~~TRINITY_DN535_c0_g1_i14.p2  ORF type:complete len:163 (-),score=28.54 TRINITY_DN535_c0_g1_i14:323-811(-)
MILQVKLKPNQNLSLVQEHSEKMEKERETLIKLKLNRIRKGEESDILTSFLKITTVSTRNDTSDKTKTESKPLLVQRHKQEMEKEMILQTKLKPNRNEMILQTKLKPNRNQLLVQKHKQGKEKEMILQTKLKPNRNQLLVRKHKQEMEKEMILQTKLYFRQN